MKDRWILITDEESHWYVIPKDDDVRFMDWAQNPDEIEKDDNWHMVGGCQTLVTFCEPIIDGIVVK